MSETVFVLGAGASREAGGPLTTDFLDGAETVMRSPKTSDQDREDFELVFEGVAALKNSLANAQIETDNIEAVFAAFEMARLIGYLPNLNREQIARLPSAMRRLIQRTLEDCIRLPRGENQVLRPRH